MADREVDVLIVGGGAAGAACAHALRRARFRGSVLLATREPLAPYERPPVSKGYLRGTEAAVPPLEVPEDVEVLTRASVMKLDPAARTARFASKQEVAFGQAVLATGANVRRLRVDGAQLGGLHYLRAPGNADAVRADVEAGARRAVLVGGSYIACEVAASLTGMGVACTMVMLEDEPLSTHFGPAVGSWAARLLRDHGVELLGAEQVARFEGAERVERVVCASGRTLAADLVVLGTGAVPDVTLARAAGLELGETGGIACSAALETSAPGIWAAGDACEYESVLHGRRVRIEHWDVARAQGRHVARAIARGSAEPYAELPSFWSDLADWATITALGPLRRWDAEAVRGSFDEDAFTVFHLDGSRLVAALSCGRGEDLMAAHALIAAGTDLGPDAAARLADLGAPLPAG